MRYSLLLIILITTGILISCSKGSVTLLESTELPSTTVPTATSTPEPTRTPTPIPTNRPISLLLWETNFSNGKENFDISIDQSVGCDKFPIQPSDIALQTIQDLTAPSASISVLELIANTSNKGGLFVNAIAHRDVKFIDDSRYIFEGYFKKVTESKPEQIDINLQLVQDYTEYYAEIIWTLNLYSPFHNWIWTRGHDFQPIKLFELRDDSNWHYFKLVTEYESNPTSRYIRTIQVDNQSAALDLEMGTVHKEWQSSFIALVETHNMYTNCDQSLVFVGKSRWDNIRITIEPIP